VHPLYLQLRKSILENHIMCTDGVHQQNHQLGKYLRSSHFSKRGLHPKEAERNFIRYVQEMREYGIHYISGVWTRDDKIELNGIKIFERNSAARSRSPSRFSASSCARAASARRRRRA
jgi:hypothetical protein